MADSLSIPADTTQDSPLKAVPSPDVIRERIIRNSEENRYLRSLYKLSRRLREATESAEVAHAS